MEEGGRSVHVNKPQKAGRHVGTLEEQIMAVHSAQKEHRIVHPAGLLRRVRGAREAEVCGERGAVGAPLVLEFVGGRRERVRT